MTTVIARLGYELRALGVSILALPPIVVGVFLGVTLLAVYSDSRAAGSASQMHHDIATGMLYLLEFGIPPVAGLAAAHLIASDPAKELHLAAQHAYPRTMLLRLGLFTIWAALVAATVALVASRAGYELVTRPAPQDQLTWIAPLLWCVAVGAALALLVRSAVASSAILGMLWLGELLLKDYFLGNAVLQKQFLFLTIVQPDASFWLANREALIAAACVLIVIIALLLRNNERLLGQES